jgi:hypothetical protein
MAGMRRWWVPLVIGLASLGAIVTGAGMILRQLPEATAESSLRSRAETIAEATRDFIATNKRFPRTLSDLQGYGSGYDFTRLIEESNPELVVDPKSNAGQALIWVKSRTASSPKWYWGCEKRYGDAPPEPPASESARVGK